MNGHDTNAAVAAFPLVGTSAIVTGAGQGIGLDIARHLMRAGADVLIYDINREVAAPAAEALMGELPQRRAVAFVGDVAEESDMRAAYDLAIAELGMPRILVNNAGISDLRPLVRLSVDEWRRVFDVCALGTFLGTRELARRYMESGLTGGAVISTSSLNCLIPSEGLGHYVAAKAAVSQFTKQAALELAPLEIRVNAIAPGVVATPLAASYILGDDTVAKGFIDRTPLGRFGETGDIAKVAVFLASEAAGWITGETIHVDGGAHMRGLPNFWRDMAPVLGLPEVTPGEWHTPAGNAS
jgi:NAD(P)-dependent dehydrogenase (short-subunit alcohol dehydrogenase family)